MNHDTEPIIGRDLDQMIRYAIVNKVLNKIYSHDLPEILALVDRRIKYDIVGKLPMELVAIICQYVDLKDIFRLRVVSRRWHTILSSKVVQYTFIHAPSWWLQKRYSATPNDFIKKWFRILNGQFVTTISYFPLHQRQDPWAKSTDYSNGRFAWIDSYTSQVLSVLNIWTGELVSFTTEDRQKLRCVRVSVDLAVAITGRTCRFWHLQSRQYFSFQLPDALCEGRILVHGPKVMLLCEKHLVHWSFASRTAHITVLEDLDSLRVLDLDENEDGYTLVYCPAAIPDLQGLDITETLGPRTESREVHVEHFALKDGGFESTAKRIEMIPLHGLDKRISAVSRYSNAFYSLHPGQGSLNAERVTHSGLDMDSDANQGLFGDFTGPRLHYLNLVSLENGGNVVFHHLSLEEHELPGDERLRTVSPNPGIIYASQGNCTDGDGWCTEPIIFHCTNSAPGSVRSYSKQARFSIPYGCHVHGDEDFMISLYRDQVNIQSFNGRDIWDPEAIAWPFEVRNMAMMGE